MTMWCRCLKCTNNEGQLYMDANGPMGCCKLEENEINRDGKCEDKGENK
jgi:hypothetical protein